jgi:hypothetical protein
VIFDDDGDASRDATEECGSSTTPPCNTNDNGSGSGSGSGNSSDGSSDRVSYVSQEMVMSAFAFLNDASIRRTLFCQSDAKENGKDDSGDDNELSITLSDVCEMFGACDQHVDKQRVRTKSATARKATTTTTTTTTATMATSTSTSTGVLAVAVTASVASDCTTLRLVRELHTFASAHPDRKYESVQHLIADLRRLRLFEQHKVTRAAILDDCLRMLTSPTCFLIEVDEMRTHASILASLNAAVTQLAYKLNYDSIGCMKALEKTGCCFKSVFALVKAVKDELRDDDDDDEGNDDDDEVGDEGAARETYADATGSKVAPGNQSDEDDYNNYNSCHDEFYVDNDDDDDGSHMAYPSARIGGGSNASSKAAKFVNDDDNDDDDNDNGDDNETDKSSAAGVEGARQANAFKSKAKLTPYHARLRMKVMKGLRVITRRKNSDLSATLPAQRQRQRKIVSLNKDSRDDAQSTPALSLSRIIRLVPSALKKTPKKRASAVQPQQPRASSASASKTKAAASVSTAHAHAHSADTRAATTYKKDGSAWVRGRAKPNRRAKQHAYNRGAAAKESPPKTKTNPHTHTLKHTLKVTASTASKKVKKVRWLDHTLELSLRSDEKRRIETARVEAKSTAGGEQCNKNDADLTDNTQLASTLPVKKTPTAHPGAPALLTMPDFWEPASSAPTQAKSAAAVSADVSLSILAATSSLMPAAGTLPFMVMPMSKNRMTANDDDRMPLSLPNASPEITSSRDKKVLLGSDTLPFPL